MNCIIRVFCNCVSWITAIFSNSMFLLQDGFSDYNVCFTNILCIPLYEKYFKRVISLVPSLLE